MVACIRFVLSCEEASETVGKRRTQAEFTNVDGKRSRLNAMPVNTP